MTLSTYGNTAPVRQGVIADKLLREIAKVIATIDDFPLAGRSRDEIRAGLRSLVSGPHVVFYR
jgi:toxin ParE1/3/4